jgi:hypothetical protein
MTPKTGRAIKAKKMTGCLDDQEPLVMVCLEYISDVDEAEFPWPH